MLLWIPYSRGRHGLCLVSTTNPQQKQPFQNWPCMLGAWPKPSWWLKQPLWKILVKMDIFRKYGWKLTKWKNTTQRKTSDFLFSFSPFTFHQSPLCISSKSKRAHQMNFHQKKTLRPFTPPGSFEKEILQVENGCAIVSREISQTVQETDIPNPHPNPGRPKKNNTFPGNMGGNSMGVFILQIGICGNLWMQGKGFRKTTKLGETR